MEAVDSHAPPAAGGHSRSPRLLGIASDEFLVRRVRAGSEAAFEALYERHYRKVLSFCRHMLGSPAEAEDAVQQTFINALQGMLRDEKELRFRPWLYRIARNLCISALRARRHDVELAETEPSLTGLSEQVAGRRELRDLLHDLSELPVDQREALVLSELHGNSHTEVAEMIGCDKEKVKSLVFQARSSLIKSREAREVSCEEIRRQLSVLRGGSLRRGIIRRHLGGCEGCRRFDREVKHQRQALALALPVIPSVTLKLGAASAAAAVGIKGGAAAAGGSAVAGGVGVAGGGAAAGATVAGGGVTVVGGGATVAGGGAAGGAASGSLAAAAGKLGVPLLVVKGAAATAAVTMVAAGGAAGLKATNEIVRGDPHPALESTRESRGTVGDGQAEGPGGAPAHGGTIGGRERARARGRRDLATPGSRRSRHRGARDGFGRAERDALRLERGAGHPDRFGGKRKGTRSPSGALAPERPSGRRQASPERSKPRSRDGYERAPSTERRRRSLKAPRRERPEGIALPGEPQSQPPAQSEVPPTREGETLAPQR